MKDRTSNAKLKGAKWPEGKTANNGSKPPGPPATGMPVALRKRQLETVPTTITSQASVLGETGGQSVKRWPRSKYNAITHGIFGPVVLEGCESAKEYDRLVRSLRENWQPEGVQEELLVEQLAALYWRRRRVYEAEHAEILRGMEAVRSENQARQEDEFRRVDTPVTQFDGGLLRYAHNPLIIHRCVEILKDWRESLAEHQLDCELGYNILLQIYGFEDLMIPRGDLPVVYSIIVEQRESAGESRKGRRLARKLKRGLLKHIHREIERLVQLEEKVRKQQNERLSCEARTHMVPMVSERLMRYDTTLSRDIQRTMIQLEHLQRRRRGEGDLPPIQLDISS